MSYVVPDADLVTLTETGRFSKVSLMPASSEGYLLLGAEVDRAFRGTFPICSAVKRRMLSELKQSATRILATGLAKSATVFTALLIPPGRGAYLRQRPDATIASYDVALLIRTEDLNAARTLSCHGEFQSTQRLVKSGASSTYTMLGENVRRIAPVEHERGGVFLLNYFLAQHQARNLAVWEHTAGWFQEETGLNNSELLRPIEENGATYTLVNHCRWSSLFDVLPSLIFKPSFRSYVLRHFEANQTAAMPILYGVA